MLFRSASLTKSKIVLLSVMIAAFSFSAGIAVGKRSFTEWNPFAPEASSVFGEKDFTFFRRVIGYALAHHIDREVVDPKEILYTSLEGAVYGLGDPYSEFLRPKANEDFFSDLNGSFEGIGAELAMRSGNVVVVAAFEGSPAQKAGLLAGDAIITVNKESVAGKSLGEVVQRIRGEAGTNVVLTIVREETELTLSITRGAIQIESVEIERRTDGIVVVKVRQFNENMYDRIGRLPRETISEDTRGIIIDLRNNTGGYLNAAIDFANLWIKDGVIVIEENANKKRTEYRAKGNARLTAIPTAVIVNGGSASASEIFAGALQDYKLATIVGEKTFGKGSVQEIQEFPDGSAVKITTARWLTPHGRSIDETGIEPDIVVPFSQEAYDRGEDSQLIRAIELFTK